MSDNTRVVWSWYYGDSSNSCNNKIEGAQGNTFTVTDAYLGKYIQVRADGGFGEEKATRGPVVEAGAVALHHVEVTGSAKVGVVLTAAAYTSSYPRFPRPIRCIISGSTLTPSPRPIPTSRISRMRPTSPRTRSPMPWWASTSA